MKLHRLKQATISREQFAQQHLNETECKPLPINNGSVKEGIVVKEEYIPGCVETSTGVNQTNPLNVNIEKVETIVDKSEMEEKTIIQVKKEIEEKTIFPIQKEVIGTHSGTFEDDEEITMNVNTVKVEGVKKEHLPSEEYTYL